MRIQGKRGITGRIIFIWEKTFNTALKIRGMKNRKLPDKMGVNISFWKIGRKRPN